MASNVKWIKIATDIFEDEKILLIESLPNAYALLIVWFKLLCFAGRQNNGGVFVMGTMPYTAKMLATIFRMEEYEVTAALETFEKFGMVATEDGVIRIPNWNKHQSLDAFEKRRERDKTYQQEKRKQKKELALQATGSRLLLGDESADSRSMVGVSEGERKEETEEAKIDTKGAHMPPTIDEVTAYCTKRGNCIDPQRFIDYYASCGWRLGNGAPIRDWRACVRNWERREQSKAEKEPPSEYEAMVERYVPRYTKQGG